MPLFFFDRYFSRCSIPPARQRTRAPPGRHPTTATPAPLSHASLDLAPPHPPPPSQLPSRLLHHPSSRARGAHEQQQQYPPAGRADARTRSGPRTSASRRTRRWCRRGWASAWTWPRAARRERGDVVRLGRRDGAPRGRHLLAPAVAAVRCEPPHATPELRGLQRPPAGQDVGAPRAASASSACGRSRGAVAIHVPAHECSRAQFGIGAFEGSNADQEATAT